MWQPRNRYRAHDIDDETPMIYLCIVTKSA